MDILQRATQLLRHFMGEDHRDAWLTLAFHGEHHGIYDGIPQNGATSVFTVRCVRYLLERGCVGTRHALSLLLETVRGEAGSELQEHFQTLIDELDRQCTIQTHRVSDAGNAAQPSTLVSQVTSMAKTDSVAGVAPPVFPLPLPQPSDGVAAAECDFFVSYYQADQDWAEWIAWQLEEAGYSTLIQAWDFHAGGHFVLEMDRAATTTQQTIVILSNNFRAAQSTPPEWAAAFRQDRTGAQRALLLRVAECPPEGWLAGVVFVDLLGLDEPTAKQTLLAWIRDERLKPSRSPGFPGRSAQRSAAAPVFPGVSATDKLPGPLRVVREALGVRHEILQLPEKTLQEILRHTPRTLEEYRLARIAEWSQPRHALDKRFTRLTLLLDQGPDTHGPRWQVQQKRFNDLRAVLTELSEPALVLLGPPGCGKSTLLRRLELDLAVDALRAGEAEPGCLSFFVPLNRYRPARSGEALPRPMEWLAQEWARRYPKLPAFDEVLHAGRFVLLLDAVNELPHRNEADYRERIHWWRDFVAELPAGTRVLFSCRSLDYSASLSTPELSVPHVRIERLSDHQVEKFLTLHDSEHGPALWRQLRGTPQLDLFRSLFFLKLLLAQAGDGGPALSGRAALFSGFVRQALLREIASGNPLFRPGALLDRRDHERILRCQWRNAIDLPVRGPLLPALCQLAFALQARRVPGEASRVRVPYDDARQLLRAQPGDDLLHAGIALQVLEVQWDDVLYVHQLLQEYFAARVLAGKPQPKLVASAWRADEISPTLAEVLASLADSDPLPEVPTTGWEETVVLAAAMASAPEAFVTTLMAVNLPLAGRCAAQPDVILSDTLRRRLQQALVARTRDPAVDLRARIAAARALGGLGDPRFAWHSGPHGEFLLPPLVAVDGGSYSIGSAEELTAHQVQLGPFAIGQFPVSNAEWSGFIDAGGYEDERWWPSKAAQRWRRGEGVTEGEKPQQREFRQWLRDNPKRIEQLLREERISSKQAKEWETIRQMSDTEFDALLDDWYPSGRQTQPAYWNDPAYNDPSQPVVGICCYEALAYCAWLSAQTGQSWRLPSEDEWEAAARGPEHRRYAWGEVFDATRCNTFESHVRGTTPIGVFPGGDTPEGLVDMCGNVWEWTSSPYLPYSYSPNGHRKDPAQAEVRRVLRGGSWYYGHGFARCTYRLGFLPGYRSGYLGLRLVCLSPSVQSS